MNDEQRAASIRSRNAAAREAANDLLEELESGDRPIMGAIMRAKKLARLLTDTDAQGWLEFEASGYPDAFNSKTLGTAYKYALAGGRLETSGRYFAESLPQIEAAMQNHQHVLRSSGPSVVFNPNVSSSNPNEFVSLNLGRAAEKLASDAKFEQNATWQAYTQRVKLFNGMKSALHSYAADKAIALEFGDYAESLFEEARTRVDAFIGRVAPKAAQQLLAAKESLRAGDAESLSHALTSCRRLMATVADELFPPRSEYTDAKGKKRDVGPEQYKNRILAYIEEARLSGSTTKILENDLEHLAKRLDAVYEKACKGVHADVTIDEVRVVIIGMYMFLGELANVAAGKGTVVAIAPAGAVPSTT